MENATRLSKSKILLHRQCPKRLWLKTHHPELAEVDQAAEARMRDGNVVGDIARQLYPGVISLTPWIGQMRLLEPPKIWRMAKAPFSKPPSSMAMC